MVAGQTRVGVCLHIYSRFGYTIFSMLYTGVVAGKDGLLVSLFVSSSGRADQFELAG